MGNYTIKKTTKLSKLTEVYCTRLGVERKSLRFIDPKGNEIAKVYKSFPILLYSVLSSHSMILMI